MSRSVRPDSLLQPEFRSSGEERRTSASANSVFCLPHYRFDSEDVRFSARFSGIPFFHSSKFKMR